MNAKFGPAGNSLSFAEMGYQSNSQIPEYLKKFGLTAYEYQCGHGLRVSEKALRNLAEEGRKQGITFSLHSPYYISLSSLEKEKREKSVEYLLQSAQVARWLGAERIVVHSGSCAKQTREQALALAGDTLMQARKRLDEEGFEEIILCPETMGKTAQLGDLEEVLSLCCLEKRFLPCIDFGHLNARAFGQIQGKEAYAHILDRMEERIGLDRTKIFHSHFSRIEFTNPGGEKRHRTFAEKEYGPEYQPLMELIAERGYTPTFICESAGTQAEDAAVMKEYYFDRLRASQ